MKKKSCNGCKAYNLIGQLYKDQNEKICHLDYKTELIVDTPLSENSCLRIVLHRPVEDCPKPRTVHEFVRILQYGVYNEKKYSKM
jgi:hypothetical protein